MNESSSVLQIKYLSLKVECRMGCGKLGAFAQDQGKDLMDEARVF
ncbi:hypothetical protein RUM4293_03643 [Ruegeria atlantica]|uniref:Uncharacterized protein n=1 Tax=Ruegeria atlantica TaxID=81569 RepID=A0A0P1E7V4_9RHOB|nr:hypothetical protein RUM4293_03643 [Ruegeria atlantica]